jgi:hypothetical protein
MIHPFPLSPSYFQLLVLSGPWFPHDDGFSRGNPLSVFSSYSHPISSNRLAPGPLGVVISFHDLPISSILSVAQQEGKTHHQAVEASHHQTVDATPESTPINLSSTSSSQEAITPQEASPAVAQVAQADSAKSQADNIWVAQPPQEVGAVMELHTQDPPEDALSDVPEIQADNK